MKEQKLAAIVFTDIVGYTKRMEADEEKTMQLLSRQREIVFPLVKEFGGEVIKEIGDGLLMMFHSAYKAVRFAMTLQEKLEGEELIIRAGIHIGDVIFEGGDVFGSAVNIAARIEPLALPGGICISEDVRNQIRNKGDVMAVSIGRKRLKGVNDLLEIYRISHSAREQQKFPFYKLLWRKRVFQISAFYLVLAYLLRLAMEYTVKEYMLSPYLTNLIWYLSLSLIPSIILIAFFHGRKKTSKWHRAELIGLPVNLVLAVFLVIFLFKGKELGAATKTVTVQDETGATIEKTIFKNEFRKNILLFNIENKSGDPDLDYLQYGIPVMTNIDLSQDLLITPEHTMEFLPAMVDAGYKDGVGLPLTLMKRYAEKSHVNHFLTGELTMQDKEYILNLRLFDTKLSRQISGFTVMANTPFKLVDQLTVEIKKAMGLPLSHIDETADLPVSEISTASNKALRYLVQALRADAMKNWEEKLKFLELAIQEDPEFAIAYFVASLAYFDNNDIAATLNALQQIMDHYLHKLPERTGFNVKYYYYILNQQPEKAFTVVKMWAKLFPDDLAGHEMLANIYSMRNMQSEAISEYKEIIRLDAERYDILCKIGDLYLANGNIDSALIYYQQNARMLPQEAESYKKLGDYYVRVGDFEPARKNYENALAVADATEKEGIMINLGNVLRISGQFDQAYKQYMNVLSNAKNATDSATAYGALQNYYLIKGQVKKSLEVFELRVEKIQTILAPLDLAIFRTFNISPYINAGEPDKAIKILDDLAPMLEPPIDKLISVGYMEIYIENGDTAKAMEAISSAEELVREFGEINLMTIMYKARAKLNESNEKYQEAIENYKHILEISAVAYDVYADISRCYRLMNEFKKAEDMIQIALQYRPFDPVNNYEAGLLFLAMGDEEKALPYLRKAVDIWKDAEPEYDKANAAKNLLASL
ncbi:MAG: adenylate/guanylate cyclase domain-containing protein [Bacteroidales bacterium]|nr:adenylate/guanylate cyclase domain-containing protein [Bacteroidales bacterium]